MDGSYDESYSHEVKKSTVKGEEEAEDYADAGWVVGTKGSGKILATEVEGGKTEEGNYSSQKREDYSKLGLVAWVSPIEGLIGSLVSIQHYIVDTGRTV